MARKNIVLSGDSTGRVSMGRAAGPQIAQSEVIEPRRVPALYPLEPTRNSKVILDREITRAINKRLRKKA